jgi:hypothetical protein
MILIKKTEKRVASNKLHICECTNILYTIYSATGLANRTPDDDPL